MTPTPLPSYDDLLVLPAHNALTVPPAFEDRNGHMNVAHYLTTASWGVEHAMLDAGVPDDWHETAHLGTFAVEHHLVYLGEVRVGSDVSVRVRYLGRSQRALHLQAFLLDDTHRRLSYTMELMSVHIDFGTRRSAVWPDDLASTFDSLVAEHAALPWPAPISGSMSLR